MLYRTQNTMLQFAVFVCLGVIGGILYYNNTDMKHHTEDIQQDITDQTDEIKGDIDTLKQLKTPSVCRDCPDPPSCPTVEEIASAVFPGRNTGLTSGGKYFNVQGSDSYELLPDHDFYKSEDAFAEDSILDRPLRDAPPLLTGGENSVDGFHMDTSQSARMNQGLGQAKREVDKTTRSKADD
jgi:hypothetical protein